MVNTRKKFPRGILDQAISGASATASVQRASDPGLKLQALIKLVNACIDQWEPQAPSIKPQAPSNKLQATSLT